jgi:aspartate beta-hydroxylase
MKGFQPYRGPSWTSKIPADDGVGHLSHDKGDWNVYYLYLHEIKFDQNCAKVPKTLEIIDKYIPRQYYHAFFSAVNPGTHILKHHGPTNKKLRFHLPLLGVKGSRLRVADQVKEQESGVPYVFDDSFDHEVSNDNNKRLGTMAMRPGLS